MRMYVEMTDEEVSTFASRWLESQRRLSLVLALAAAALLLALNVGIGLLAYRLARHVGIPAVLTMFVLTSGAMAMVPLAAVAHVRLLVCPNCRTYLIRPLRDVIVSVAPGLALLFLAAGLAAVAGVWGRLAVVVTSSWGVFLMWRALMRACDPCPRCHLVLSSATRELSQRLAAVEKLTDRVSIAQLAKNEDEDWTVRQAALSRLVDLEVTDRRGQDAAGTSAGPLSAQAVLVALAKHDGDSHVRVVAAEKVTDQDVLAEIADSDMDAAVRMAAKRRLKALRGHQG